MTWSRRSPDRRTRFLATEAGPRSIPEAHFISRATVGRPPADSPLCRSLRAAFFWPMPCGSAGTASPFTVHLCFSGRPSRCSHRWPSQGRDCIDVRETRRMRNFFVFRGVSQLRLDLGFRKNGLAAAQTQTRRSRGNRRLARAEAPDEIQEPAAVCDDCFEMAWSASSASEAQHSNGYSPRLVKLSQQDSRISQFACSECQSVWSWTQENGWIAAP